MVYLDLFLNLALLVALSLFSSYWDQCWPANTRRGALLQGALFGGVAVVAMLRPFQLAPGLFFDGRSVILSLCALFFGPPAGALSAAMAVACRLYLGGVGAFTGVLVILCSTGIGLAGRRWLRSEHRSPSAAQLYLLGWAVHLVMLGAMFTLPEGGGWLVLKRLGAPILLLFPPATILAGKILSDRMDARRRLLELEESEHRFKAIFEGSRDALFLCRADASFAFVNPAACRLTGYSTRELTAKSSHHRWISDTSHSVTGMPRRVHATPHRCRSNIFGFEILGGRLAINALIRALRGC